LSGLECRKRSSLRSKRFRGVDEQRKTGEDFRVFSRAKLGQEPKKKRNSPSLLFPFRLLPHFLVPWFFFASQPHGNACYAGLMKMIKFYSNEGFLPQKRNYSSKMQYDGLNMQIIGPLKRIKFRWGLSLRQGNFE